MCLPIASPAGKYVFANASVTTTTGGGPNPSSSFRGKRRPWINRTPIVEKKFADTGRTSVLMRACPPAAARVRVDVESRAHPVQRLERAGECDGDRLCARQGRESFTNLIGEMPKHRDRIPYFRRRKRDVVNENDVLRSKTRIDLNELDEAPNQQAGADEQNDRQRHLADDEHVSRSLRAAASARAAHALSLSIWPSSVLAA